MIESMLTWAPAGLIAILGLYVVVRVASAAFYKSRQQFEKEQRHEPLR